MTRIEPMTVSSLGLRLTSAAALILLAGPTFPLGWTIGWTGAVLAAEVFNWLTSRQTISPDGPTPRQRNAYLASVLAINATWWAASCLLWVSGVESFRFAACFMFFSLINHAQTLLNRSAVMLAIVSGAPALLLVTLVLFFSHFSGRERLVVLASTFVMAAYCAKAITANNRRTEEMALARREADLANQAKTDFLARMSHELRTPMAGMIGMAHALRLGNLPKRQHRQAELMVRSGENLLDLLNDILDLSKVEANRLELETIAFDLAQIAELADGLWTEAATAKGLDFRCEVSPSGPIWLSGDPTRIRQVIMNLISNAVKFTQGGAVTLAIEVVDTAVPDGVLVTLRVQDSGIGISAEQQARIFEPFSQVDASISRRFGGTGLGLSIVRQMVALMDGSLAVDSVKGAGSTFTVTLPLTRAQPPPQDVDEDGASLEGLKILVVDDNATNRVVAEALLSAIGCVVLCAADGLEALKMLQGQRFDAVLMDLHMPGMSGEAAVAAIRAGEVGQVDVPVIALTADLYLETVTRLLATGFNAVEAKPIILPRLISAILENVRGASPVDALEEA